MPITRDKIKLPIALSNWDITKDTFTVTSVDNFVTKMNVYLTSVHWVGTAVTGGFRYLITSPQGRQVYCFIRNLGHRTGGVFTSPQCTINFKTIDGTITGMDHEIIIRGTPDNVFVIIAGKSQLALARIGVHEDNLGSSIVCGIPFISGEASCGGIRPSVPSDQCFFAMGDHQNGGSPRKYLLLGSGLFGPESQNSCEALWGTDLCGAGNSIGSIRIPVFTYASSIFHGFNFPSNMNWASHDFFRLEPLLVWGNVNAAEPVIRAQLWDSMIFTRPFSMDYTVQMDGLTWYVFTNNYLFGVLAFISGSTGSNGNPDPDILGGSSDKFAAFVW